MLPNICSSPSSWEVKKWIWGKETVWKIHSTHTSTRQTLFAYDSLHFRSRYLPGALQNRPIASFSAPNAHHAAISRATSRQQEIQPVFPSLHIHLQGKARGKRSSYCCAPAPASQCSSCCTVHWRKRRKEICMANNGCSQPKDLHPAVIVSQLSKGNDLLNVVLQLLSQSLLSHFWKAVKVASIVAPSDHYCHLPKQREVARLGCLMCTEESLSFSDENLHHIWQVQGFSSWQSLCKYKRPHKAFCYWKILEEEFCTTFGRRVMKKKSHNIC